MTVQSNKEYSYMDNSNRKFDEELIDFKKMFSLFQRHLWVILFCFIAGLSFSYYMVNEYLLPVYQSKGTLLISSNETALPGAGGESGVSSIISRSFAAEGGNAVQRATYLFESRELSENIAQELLEASESKSRDKFPSTWTSYPDDSTLITPQQLASRIRNGLNVSPDERGSNLLEVTFQSYSVSEAAEIVNISLEEFLEKSLEKKKNTANRALTFLEGKKEEIQAQLNEAEDRLVKFKSENKIMSSSNEVGNPVNSLSELKAEKQSLQIQLESLNASIDNYEKQMESIKPGLADEFSKAVGPTIDRYQQTLAELRTQRFIILSKNPQLKSNPNSEPELRKINQQISELEEEIQSLSEGLIKQNESLSGITTRGDGNLAQELANIQRNLTQLRIQKNQLESEIQVLNERITNSEDFLETLPENQVKLAQLETQVQRQKELLNTIITQESETALWQQTQNSSGTIVDRANPNFDPVKPNKLLWYAFSGLIGLILPVGIFFLRESLNTDINSLEQIKSYPYPLLSVVYDHSLVKTNGWLNSNNRDGNSTKISKDVVFYHNVDTPIAESYRKIVSQVLYTNPDSTPNSILITSSGPSEGKTTLSANLGAAFAEVDKKVLIVDCDFRRPASHKLFSIENKPGIKEVLFDGEKLSDAIQDTGIPDLYLLPTGSKPASPTQLLASEKFKELIRVLRPNYDMILFDSPPQALVSEVSSLMTMTDLVIVVAKFGVTNNNVLKHTLEDLDRGGKSLSLVLTGYEPENSYDSYDTKGIHKYIYKEYYEYEKVLNDNKT